MNQQTITVTLGCLLHDLGKLCYRGGDSGRHSAAGYRFLKDAWSDYAAGDVLDCLRWHHSAELREAKPAGNSVAYIAWEADNISAAADRRTESEGGGFERYLPLSPVFTHLNGEHGGHALSAEPLDGSLRMPLASDYRLTQGDYAELCRRLAGELKNLQPKEEWINSLLAVLETYTGSVPSSTNTGESPDISLYDHAKVCAAAGACISEYFLAQGKDDFRALLWDNEAAFREEKVFLLYSADFSGIQKFIYTVSTRNALRSLRSRSFFLELTMEHYIDELLTACGLSRANLLYSGGGHCYMLLPHTPRVKEAIEHWNTRFNNWLLSSFGVSLYLADGYTPCSANELTNSPPEMQPYKELFRRVSSSVAKKKLHRYTAQQIIRMNRASEELSGRECRVCGRTDRLVESEDGESLCPWCAGFERLSAKIQRSRVYVVTEGSETKADFTLPTFEGEASFTLTDVSTAREMLTGEKIRRIYTKNESYAGLRYSTRIYVGDYAASNSMEELAGSSQGIRRLAVCRMDVDDLGQSFVAGFEKESASTATARQHFVTISRTAAFSRQMSLFFKLYINAVLSGAYGNKDALHVAIVYSGGDDVFLVGAWNDALEAARRIRAALREYSCGALTISGGVGIFDSHYPIRLAAAKTAELEEEAKKCPGKDALALFEAGSGNRYAWEEFEKDVVGEKLRELERFFYDEKQTERGTAFLYRILELLRQAQTDEAQRLPLARIAYLLSRLEPSRGAANYGSYKEFASRLFSWSLSKTDRGSLITAIYLFVYKNRREDR